MKTFSSKLPDKLHKLIKVAYKDIITVANDSRYILNMLTWHKVDINNRCHVCLAGAVMAGSLNADIKDTLDTDDFSSVESSLHALNYVRMGQYTLALSEFYSSLAEKYKFLDYPELLDFLEMSEMKAYEMPDMPSRDDIETFFSNPIMKTFISLLVKYDL